MPGTTQTTNPSLVISVAVFVLSIIACRDGQTMRSDPVHWPADTIVYEDTLQACSACGIRLEPLATFGSTSDSVLLLNIPFVERDSKGRFYSLVFGNLHHEVLMHDEHGKFLRAIGRRGAGPGEFEMMVHMAVGPGDSLFVLHDKYLTVFDSTGRMGRSVRFAASTMWRMIPSIVGFLDSGILLSASKALRGPDTLGVPLRVYDHRGTLVRGYGPLGLTGEYNKSRGHAYGKRTSVMASDGSVWLGDEGYRIEKVDTLGRVTHVIGVKTPSDWGMPLYMTMEALLAGINSAKKVPVPNLPPRDANATTIRPRARPRTLRAGIGLIEDTLLVVLIHTAAADWQKVEGKIDPLKSDADHRVIMPGYIDRLHDTFVDILHTGTGQLLARKRFPGTLNLTSDGTLYRSSVDDAGVVRVETFALKFTGSALPR